MKLTRAMIAAAVAVALGLAVGQLGADAQTDRYEADRSDAADVGLSLGPIPDEFGMEPDEFGVDKVPDLIPVGEGDEIWGYAYADEAFADLLDPNVVVIAYGIYEADGKTLLGHVIPGKGFVAGSKPIATTRAAVVPD